MDPKDVYKMRPEYKQYDQDRFCANVKALRERIDKYQAKADADSRALAHDRILHPPPATNHKGYPRWCDSDAERLLKQDMDAGKHLTMKPKDLRKTRSEYLAFPPKTFRDHIHQESRNRRETPYWLAQNARKGLIL